MIRKVTLLITLLSCLVIVSGCASGNNAGENNAVSPQSANLTPPVIDHLDSYPFPVLTGWKEQKFEVREYDEGMNWEAVFLIDGDETEQAAAYHDVIEALGYETYIMLGTVIKMDVAEFAGVTYHGTFTFNEGDEYSEWGKGQKYVEITFTEKK